MLRKTTRTLVYLNAKKDIQDKVKRLNRELNVSGKNSKDVKVAQLLLWKSHYTLLEEKWKRVIGLKRLAKGKKNMARREKLQRTANILESQIKELDVSIKNLGERLSQKR